MRRMSALRVFAHVALTVLAGLALGLAALGLLAPDARAQSPITGPDEAASLLTRTQFGGSLEGVRLYVSPRMLPAGETVSAWHREIFTASAPGWFLFVDPLPGANWEHPCSYYLVDAATGAVSRYDATTPPNLQPELAEVTSGRDNPDPGVSEAALERFSERLRGLPKPPAPDRGQAWAFIISGGANQSNNHIRYWNDCAFIYRALVEYYGYADDHIRVCISDGTNTAVDRSDGTNSPTDLDGDGDADTEYPATLQYVDQVFDELAATLTPSDQLFIFTTDHGGQVSGQDCYLNLWNVQELPDEQMAAYVNALPCETVICTFEQCYSGGMIDDLQGNGRVIATAAHWSEVSWAMAPDYIYDTFVYFWTCAVGWETPSGAPVDADTNDDGLVSMHEAFLYAEQQDFSDETPQYSSTPAELGDQLFLFGNLQGTYLAVEELIIDDDAAGGSSGDGDGIVDFGETIELTVALHNMGMTGAQNVVGTLTSGSPYVTILAGQQGFGAIPAEGTATNGAPFVLQVAHNAPHGADLELVLNVTEEPSVLALPLAATAPAYAVSVVGIDDSSGDSDGVADPGETVGVLLRIQNTGGCDSPYLTGTLQGGAYLQSDGAVFPVGVVHTGSGNQVGAGLVTIAPDCPPIYPGHLDLLLTGPEPYEVTAGLLFPVGPWFDDAEGDNGWTLGVAGDQATLGLWVRADPVGAVYNGQQTQTEDDHTPIPGHICFVTGNGSVGGAAGEADVDGGKTTLLSPSFYVEGATSATLTYWRWYTNDLGNNPGQDYWDVDVTADGLNWVHLEHTMASANTWTEQTFDLEDYVPLNGSIRVRFVADDQSPGSLVEAAVDDIMLSIIRPPAGGAPEAAGARATTLGPCRPNPIGAGTQVSYRLAAAGPVRLELYDVAGRRVRTLFEGRAEAGEHGLSFAADDGAGRALPSGVYFLRMETPEATVIRQVAIVR